MTKAHSIEHPMVERDGAHYFVVEACHFGRTRVLATYPTLAAARARRQYRGTLYATYVGHLETGDLWLRSDEDVYRGRRVYPFAAKGTR